MKAGIVISISFGLALVLAACGKDTNLYGNWSGDRDWKSLGIADEMIARPLAAVFLELKADGSFVLSDGSVGYTGDWIQTGSGVDLRVKTILKQPIERQTEQVQKQADFVVRYDNKKLYFKNPADRSEIELEKKTKPD